MAEVLPEGVFAVDEDLEILQEKVEEEMIDQEILIKCLKIAGDALINARCDSHGGMYCEEDSCADKVCPRALEEIDAILYFNKITELRFKRK